MPTEPALQRLSRLPNIALPRVWGHYLINLHLPTIVDQDPFQFLHKGLSLQIA